MSLVKRNSCWFIAASMSAVGILPSFVLPTQNVQAQSPSTSATPNPNGNSGANGPTSPRNESEVTTTPINYSLDPLTGIYTRAGLVRILDEDSSRSSAPLASPSDVNDDSIASGQLIATQNGITPAVPPAQGSGLSQQFRTPTPLMEQGGKDSTLRLAPITVPDTNVAKIGTGIRPEDVTKDRMPVRIPLPDGYTHTQGLGHEAKQWVPGGFCRQPLYWEDPMLERHGHQRFPLAQPLVSGTRFYGTFLVLPYLTTLKGPFEEVHTLGSYRPGSPAPALRYRAHYDPSAIRNEVLAAGAVTALAAP